MLQIATILPYKENYTKESAGAASLWVCDFYKYSRFKLKNIIFGSTSKKKNYLTKNYINIHPSLLSKFTSTTTQYCNEILKILSTKKIDIIEIHNRPLVFTYLSKKIDSKFILYFHNDPISMKGSKTVKERILLYENVDKIIFVSSWVQKRFFEGIENLNLNKTDVVYPSIHKTNKFSKKKKQIVFVGKLNKSKGYDIYGNAINKILNEFKEWKSFSIGDEKREKPVISNKSHIELGYLNHKNVLKFLSQTEIAVVPSRWEEPFGRTALEASSRGCATIISNRGGLPETTEERILLKKLTSNELYHQLKKLIINTNFRKKIQKKSISNVKHITKDNSILIDKIRQSLIFKFKFNYSKNNLRILNIYNLGQKLNHRIYNMSLGKKFTNGFIRNNNDVLEISDRDYMKQNRSFKLKGVYSDFQKYLVETFKNYNPNLVFFGHTDNIDISTLKEFKELNKNIVISQWNEDPMMDGLEDSNKNISKLKKYLDCVDQSFVTTEPKIIQKRNKDFNNLNFLFIPVDRNIECFNVYNLKPEKDIFYAMSHGVNRGKLKQGKFDERSTFLKTLISKINGVKYDFYGYADNEPIWGNNFYEALINCKMGLNLSRGKPTRYYTSNRISSLIGNGLLTFIDKKTELNEIFTSKEVIFYNNTDDLSSKIKFYKDKDNLRKQIARKGKNKYFKLFNEKRIANYIIQKSFGKDFPLL